MKKYKVEFSGFAFVYADSKEEIEEDIDSLEEIYSEWEIDEIKEVED